MISAAPAQKTLLVVLGTRPEAIKLFPVIHALRAQPGVQVRVCATGQHGAMVHQILQLADIAPDYDLAVLQPGQSLDALLARLVQRLGRVMDAVHPDCIVVQGDTLSALAAGLSGHFRGIALAHVEAGLRSGNLRHPAPEEAIRKMLAAIAHYHFAPTHSAASALRAENVPADAIYVTGNSGIDALFAMRARVLAEPRLVAALDKVLDRFAGQRLIAVTIHRRENQGSALAEIAAGLAAVAQRPDVALVYPLHPNPTIRRVMRAALAHLSNVALLEPLDYPSCVALLDRASLVLTDSGGLQEEAPALGKPVLVLREATERLEAVTYGTARLVGADARRIAAEVDRLLDDPGHYAQMAQAHTPYGDGKAAPRIAQILADAVYG